MEKQAHEQIIADKIQKAIEAIFHSKGATMRLHVEYSLKSIAQAAFYEGYIYGQNVQITEEDK